MWRWTSTPRSRQRLARPGSAILVLGLLCALAGPASAQGFADPLETPAPRYAGGLAGLPIQALANTGEALLAVGMRGVILRSEDAGRNWQQVAVPLSSDLLDVSFVSPQQGWATGQDGVILASHDGGRSWLRQFDGRQALEQLSRYYQDDTALDPQARDSYLEQLRTNLQAGPVLPFFSVRFVDEQHGFAVGPFGMFVASDDGGQHWRPALHQIDNPDFLHLNAIAQVGEHLFITSEQGIVFKAGRSGPHFRPVSTGHVGSFFSLAGHGDVLLAGGLGGVLYASHDQGESWRALKSPLSQLVSRIEFDPQAQRFTAVTAGGEVLELSADLSRSDLRQSTTPMLYTDVLSLPGQVIYAGIQGLRPDSAEPAQPSRGEQ